MRLLPESGKILGGHVWYGNRDILSVSEAQMRRLRGGGISMIFQEPSISLNPFLKVSTQMVEAIRLHKNLSRNEARSKAVELLRVTGIPEAENRIDEYPYQFSGGMLQRVLIAIAAGCGVEILIADEPTSDLDVTSQAKVLDLMHKVSEDEGTSILLVTHDLGVAARMCDTICVMYAGRIVEAAPAFEFYKEPLHPYSKELLSSVPGAKGSLAGKAPITGSKLPDFRHLPAGCAFHPRCPFATGACRREPPPEIRHDDRTVRCRLWQDEQHTTNLS
jgi:oligopeptide transport system ATP-binding protein